MNLKEFKKLKTAFMKDAQKVIAGEFKEFFEKYPEVNAIRWEQYTPHFNDGDVCEFSRHGFDVRVTPNKISPELGDAELVSGTETDEDDFYSSYDLDDKTPLGKALAELEDTFSGEVDDVFKSAFGDGYRIVATRKGFKVQDYDHD